MCSLYSREGDSQAFFSILRVVQCLLPVVSGKMVPEICSSFNKCYQVSQKSLAMCIFCLVL